MIGFRTIITELPHGENAAFASARCSKALARTSSVLLRLSATLLPVINDVNCSTGLMRLGSFAFSPCPTFDYVLAIELIGGVLTPALFYCRNGE